MKNKKQAKILAAALYQAAKNKTGQELHKVVDIFLAYLKRHNWFYLIPDILKVLEDIYLVDKNMLKVKVGSRYELDNQLLDLIKDYITKKTGKRVELKSELDENLIGGVRVRYADRLIDASIKHKLNKLIKQFSN